MINTVLKFAAATALVAVCSITESQAQSRAQTTQMYNTNRVYNNTTTVNNSYSYNGGYGGGYGYRNGVGMWPGSGPYDSAIAVTAIAAGAAVLNNVIGTAAQSRQQPQGCRYVQVGTDSYGRPLFTCQ